MAEGHGAAVGGNKHDAKSQRRSVGMTWVLTAGGARGSRWGGHR
jgi:hypothetical protein